ncbi:hypothetical protein BGZ61DRAFT_229106 [Ilyonectria robusta]|uniref:uncharacterized protein n=1 Tax=Ilyonectria robusta TaxID=1079257 RepID=UPI001E8DD9D5|nr:uncharacterized protein BGZ61DRAFT_229106 [Ilyonectria robusta]KAH8651785.1 hypothetical protein BGZ61DRAFT_229106 [Ilyonectria robusta]
MVGMPIACPKPMATMTWDDCHTNFLFNPQPFHYPSSRITPGQAYHCPSIHRRHYQHSPPHHKFRDTRTYAEIQHLIHPRLRHHSQHVPRTCHVKYDGTQFHRHVLWYNKRYVRIQQHCVDLPIHRQISLYHHGPPKHPSASICHPVAARARRRISIVSLRTNMSLSQTPQRSMM